MKKARQGREETFTYILQVFLNNKSIYCYNTLFSISDFLSWLGSQITDNSCHLLRIYSKGFMHIILLNPHTTL